MAGNAWGPRALAATVRRLNLQDLPHFGGEALEPQRLMRGGEWYPQAVGIEEGGTDRLAGRRARFFLTGKSDQFIEFTRA